MINITINKQINLDLMLKERQKELKFYQNIRSIVKKTIPKNRNRTCKGARNQGKKQKEQDKGQKGRIKGKRIMGKMEESWAKGGYKGIIGETETTE